MDRITIMLSNASTEESNFAMQALAILGDKYRDCDPETHAKIQKSLADLPDDGTAPEALKMSGAKGQWFWTEIAPKVIELAEKLAAYEGEMAEKYAAAVAEFEDWKASQ